TSLRSTSTSRARYTDAIPTGLRARLRASKISCALRQQFCLPSSSTTALRAPPRRWPATASASSASLVQAFVFSAIAEVYPHASDYENRSHYYVGGSAGRLRRRLEGKANGGRRLLSPRLRGRAHWRTAIPRREPDAAGRGAARSRVDAPRGRPDRARNDRPL